MAKQRDEEQDAEARRPSCQELAIEIYEVMRLISMARLVAWSGQQGSCSSLMTDAVKRLDFVRRELEQGFDE